MHKSFIPRLGTIFVVSLLSVAFATGQTRRTAPSLIQPDRVIKPPIATVEPFTLTLPTLTARTNTVVTVPVSISDIPNVNGDGLIAYQFNISYDPAFVKPYGDLSNNFGCSTAGTLAQNLSVVCNVSPQGMLRVAAYGAYGFKGAGSILNLSFITTQNVGMSELILQDQLIYDYLGEVPIKTINGSITSVGMTTRTN